MIVRSRKTWSAPRRITAAPSSPGQGESTQAPNPGDEDERGRDPDQVLEDADQADVAGEEPDRRQCE